MSEQNGAVAVAGPTLGELYRAWVAANDGWAEAAAVLKQARAAEDDMRRKAKSIEQEFGAAVLADVPREAGRCRAVFVAIEGRLYWVEESGNAGDGYYYAVRPQQVRKLAV